MGKVISQRQHHSQSHSKILKFAYLALMIFGSLVPIFLATPHLDTYGLSPFVFIQHANSTSAAAAVFADLCISGAAFMVFCWFDISRRAAPRWEFWATLALLPIGLITSLGFYLWRRECSTHV